MDSTGNPDPGSSWIPRGTQRGTQLGSLWNPEEPSFWRNPVSGFPKEVRMMKTMAKNGEDDAEDEEEDKLKEGLDQLKEGLDLLKYYLFSAIG
ncbi:hypothetical protein SLEP1_g47354 [Rubroshorea leprosula]|uniref:Uncharacterized protein n=1 Tax=Rubroshorea leprosula TaxID=152421 RepID=A0AAV5LSU7_9ROSI|nr:hypothetical protein SLEP1_g47354 [Rubroshorea leprosula]